MTLLYCIMHVSIHNQPTIIQHLLDTGMDINQIDIDGNTPLHYAIKNGYIKAMQCLLDHKDVDTTVVNNNKFSPFYTAVWFGSPELITCQG